MVNKLRIAVVVSEQSGFDVGDIIFCDDNKINPTMDRYERNYFPNIDLTTRDSKHGCILGHNDESLISTVIDTATAKGNEALGVFLLMVDEYRYHDNKGGIGWSNYERLHDNAYKALKSLYENGIVDDTVNVVCTAEGGKSVELSRKSAIALGLLKGK